MDSPRPLIGCIGQGYVGKNYADDLEARGFEVVRYALEEPYVANKDRIASCDVVFIGVPTPTTPEGFDDSIVRDAVGLVGEGKIAVIKSTVIPGASARIQEAYPTRIVLFSPEFLREVSAAKDVAQPFANIVGMSVDDEQHRQAAEIVLTTLPSAPYTTIISSTEAEIIKYAHNASGYTQVIFFNLMYELAQKLGYGWERIGETLKADPLISNTYSNPVHKSGRGGGGHCFIKDFAALKEVYEQVVPEDALGQAVLEAIERKNIELLTNSGKDLDLLEGVYGKDLRV